MKGPFATFPKWLSDSVCKLMSVSTSHFNMNKVEKNHEPEAFSQIKVLLHCVFAA